MSNYLAWLPWPGWPDGRGISGRITVEWVAGSSWNQWPDGRGIRTGKSQPTRPPSQRWETFLKNHRECLASMDFKVTFDWRARPLFTLSVLNHHRRQLIYCRCTYHPTAEWVAQQMREAFPFDEAPARMLMDHDSIFLPVIKNTLPAMGITMTISGRSARTFSVE